MKLTQSEIEETANYLDDKVSNHFHDAIINSIGYGVEVSDEDINEIKKKLSKILWNE